MKRIRAERAMLCLTQTELGKKLGVDQRTIRRWEMGETDIPSSTILKLAKMFGCSTDWLFGLSERRN